MVSRVNVGTTLPAPAVEHRQVFSVSLDKDLLQLLYEALKRAGIDPGRVNATPVERQNSAAQPSLKQVLGTSAQVRTVVDTMPPEPIIIPPFEQSTECKKGWEPKMLAETKQPEVVEKATVEAAFHPSFIQAKLLASGGYEYPLNPDNFATRETAQWIADKYGDGRLIEVGFGGEGGPYAADTKMLYIQAPDGRLVNAGLLAAYYARNPESQFPGVADKLVRIALANP